MSEHKIIWRVTEAAMAVRGAATVALVKAESHVDLNVLGSAIIQYSKTQGCWRYTDLILLHYNRVRRRQPQLYNYVCHSGSMTVMHYQFRQDKYI